MKLDRRNFLKAVAAGTCGGILHQMLTPTRGMMAYAAGPSASLGSQSTLIVLNMSGGCSYNITPLYDGAYRDRNPTISYGPENSLPVSPEQGLHPNLINLRHIYDEGNLAIVNLVGYPTPNRSHELSAKIWQRGSTRLDTPLGGWGARMAELIGGSFSGVSLSGITPFAEQGTTQLPTLYDLENLGEVLFMGPDGAHEWLRQVRINMTIDNNQPTNDQQVFVKNSMVGLEDNLESLRPYAKTPLPVAFPNSPFGIRCRDTARLIMAGAGLGVRLVYLEYPGFDTHANEKSILTNFFTDINEGLGALITSLKAAGKWNTTTLVTMSEFCRSHENAAGGTDHGHAAPLLVFGGSVSGGIKTPPPTSSETRQGEYYLTAHTDFRAVFSQIVDAMGIDSTKVFPESFAAVNLSLFR